MNRKKSQILVDSVVSKVIQSYILQFGKNSQLCADDIVA